MPKPKNEAAHYGKRKPAAESKYQAPHCPYCGSDEVTADGPMEYDRRRGKWRALGEPYDGGTCLSCQTETKYFNWE